MSRPATELLLHREIKYSFHASEKLFLPATIGLRPTGFTTACWSGWHPTYAINDGRLFLHTITIHTSIEHLPVICRVAPTQIYEGCCKYEKLFLPLGFAGELVVTLHYPGRWGFAVVPEPTRIPSFRLTFQHGQLTAARNETFIRKTDPALEWPDCDVRIRVAENEPTPFDNEIRELPKSCLPE